MRVGFCQEHNAGTRTRTGDERTNHEETTIYKHYYYPFPNTKTKQQKKTSDWLIFLHVKIAGFSQWQKSL